MATESEITKVLDILYQDHRPTMLELLGNYTPFQMLVMTMLSSRTKDSTTIPLVKKMFAEYPQPKDFLRLKITEIEKMIYGIGFYKVKARNIQRLSKIILEKYDGKVPDDFTELTSLPGVGSKTANCIIAYTFHKPAIAVDTHVHRISNRLGWVKTSKPEETEKMLKKIVPERSWIKVNSSFVDHGQRICLPRNPRCEICPIWKYCEFGKERNRLKKS